MYSEPSMNPVCLSLLNNTLFPYLFFYFQYVKHHRLLTLRERKVTYFTFTLSK